MPTALLIVDVQNDFTEGGALAVAGGARIAADISEYLAQHHGDYALVVASRDWHNPDDSNGGHFADAPDFVDTWPPHCVAGTPGAEYHANVDVSRIAVHVKKGQGIPAYSAFQGFTDGGETLASVLIDHGITAVDIAGIATDHCVRASALDAVTEGLAVRVITRLTVGVAPESSIAALSEVAKAGATLVA